MTVRATASLRPAATDWRSGYDFQQHWPADARTAVCGEQIREQRWDRPDFPRCISCVETARTVVDAPRPRQETLEGWTEGELSEAWGR